MLFLALLGLGLVVQLAGGEVPVSTPALVSIDGRARALGLFTANSTGSESVNGCECLSQCDVSFDSLIPWCLTSRTGVSREDVVDPCGRYSARRAAFWDECIVNVTSSDHLAITFDGATASLCNATETWQTEAPSVQSNSI